MQITIKWTNKALSGLVCLYEFLELVNKPASIQIVKSLSAAPDVLLQQPRISEKVEEFEARAVRRLLVEKYEMRFEIQDQQIYILRIWHTRENRYLNSHP